MLMLLIVKRTVSHYTGVYIFKALNIDLEGVFLNAKFPVSNSKITLDPNFDKPTDYLGK